MPESRDGNDRIGRAPRAAGLRALLDDPNVKATIARIRADLLIGWKRAETSAERAQAWQALQAFDRLLAELGAAAGQG